MARVQALQDGWNACSASARAPPRRGMYSPLPEGLKYPEVHVGLERPFVLAVENVGPRLEVKDDVVENDLLLARHGQRLGQVDVRARQAGLANDLGSELHVLVDAYVEVHRHLHFEDAGDATRSRSANPTAKASAPPMTVSAVGPRPR